MQDFEVIYKKCCPYTLTSKERMLALYSAIKTIKDDGISGDFVECGVWKGGSMMLIAHTLLFLKDTSRKLYLFDTFKGASQPTEDDYILQSAIDAKGAKPNKIWGFHKGKALPVWEHHNQDNHNELYYSPLNEVKKNMNFTGYPQENIVYVEGKVEDTLPSDILKQIALLRLDTDWYESTKHELTHLFPILQKNGFLIVDDYGHFAGSKKAVDEYFKEIPMEFEKIDYAGIIGRKH
jgi:O-methyltransferase